MDFGDINERDEGCWAMGADGWLIVSLLSLTFDEVKPFPKRK
jgi:hypothetical protein